VSSLTVCLSVSNASKQTTKLSLKFKKPH